MSLRIQRVTEPSQLSESILTQWSQLAMPSPMQSPEWLIEWWRTFANSKDQLCILVVWHGDRLVGLAPWYLCHAKSSTACLRFLGDGMVCSDHSTVLTADEHNESVVSCVSDWLVEHSGDRWHSIVFEAIDATNNTVRQIVDRLSAAGHQSHNQETAGCWTVDLPGDWDGFLSSLSKNHRKRCRRWDRTYFETGRAEIECASTDQTNAAWNSLAELNVERRRQLGDRSAFADVRFHQFHQSILASFCTKEQAELRLLRIDGELAAAEYVLVQGRTIFCYQSGMRSSDNRDGFGNLSILALFRDAIERGYTRLDFLRGDEGYKEHWGAKRSSCTNHHVAAKSLAGSAQINYVRAIDWVRAVRNSMTSA